MTVKPGDRIGSYEVLAPLGAGGMGEVWRAHDSRIHRDVAIKVLAEVAASPDQLARFEQEAQAAGALNHPNVLTVFELGTHEGHPYLVTELLEGASLREKLGDTRRGAASGERLPIRKALELGAQIASGLAAAHDKGIVHRDLKPENIFVTGDGRVKILDFGLAKLTSPGGDEMSTGVQTALQPTSPGTVMGTVGYMAPEQIRGQTADPRADIFACGVVLYEMLSGARAFDGPSPADTMTAILKEDPAALSAAHAGLPLAVERIVGRCLEKEPSQRFQSARDLAFALEAVNGASTSSRQAVAPEVGARRRRWVVPLAAAVLAIGALAVGYFAGTRRGGTPLGVDQASITALTYRALVVFEAAFAPDHRTVIFSASETGAVPSIYSISPDYPEPREVGLPGTQLLAISSKGEMAVLTQPRYLEHRLFEGTLARVPVGGTAPREVLEGVRQAAWSPDGGELAIIRNVDGVDRLEYPIGKVLHTSVGYLSDLKISPRGDRIAFSEHPLKFDDRGPLKVVDLSGKVATLTEEYPALEGIAWAPDGESVYFSAGDAASEYTLRAVDLEGNVRRVRWDSGGLVIHDVSPEGSWLITDYRRAKEIWGRADRVGPDRDLSWLDGSWNPVLSRDGRMLVFGETSSVMGSQYAVCLRSPIDSGVVRLGEGDFFDLSPDGKWALALLNDSGRLLAYPTGAGEVREIHSADIDYFQGARWFPDGERLLISGGKQGRAARCFVLPLEGGPAEPVTPEGIFESASVSPTGKRIAVRDDGGRLLIFSLDGGEPTPVPGVTAEDQVVRWSSDDRAILVFRRNRLPTVVERVEIETGERSRILAVDPPDRSGLIRITALSMTDEQHYAYGLVRNRNRLFVATGLH